MENNGKVKCTDCIYSDDIFDYKLKRIYKFIRCRSAEAIKDGKYEIKIRRTVKHCKFFKDKKTRIKDTKLYQDLVKKYQTPKPYTKCKYCNSKNIIKGGIRRTTNNKIQVYHCNDCKKYFSDHNPLSKKIVNIELVKKVVKLRNDGLSYKRISKHLKRNDNLEIWPTTVFKWIKKYEYLFEKK